MGNARTNHEDPAQFMLFAPPEVLRMPDNTYLVKPGKPVVKCSVAQACRHTGLKRDNIYKLIETDMIRYERPSPRKVVVYLESLMEHLRESPKPGYWTPERRLRYFGKK